MTVKAESNVALSAPFPYFGGKSKVASLVWQALGDPHVFAEPFLGSAAVTLARPREHLLQNRREIINDADGLVANFWRAIQRDPRGVARWCEDPASKLDLVVRHRWLCRRRDRLVERLCHDPDFHDRKIAGWWCWGAATWIGQGFCCGTGEIAAKKPRLCPDGIFTFSRRDRIGSIFEALSNRLRHAVICCGDWSRCFIKSDLSVKQVGAFLDPPYAHSTGRTERLYRVEKVATDDVARWCRDQGKRSNVRIVLAGFDGEYDLPGWTVIGWRRNRSYHSTTPRAIANLDRERLWLSPHCLPVDVPAGRPNDAPVWAVSRPRRRVARTAERRRHAPDR